MDLGGPNIGALLIRIVSLGGLLWRKYIAIIPIIPALVLDPKPYLGRHLRRGRRVEAWAVWIVASALNPKP